MSKKQPKNFRRDGWEKNCTVYIDRENDEGNKEYKLKLTNKGPNRVEQLTTQMRYRVDEGNGEAIYTLGTSDNGAVLGVTEEEYKESRKILDQVAKNNNYTLTFLSEQKVEDSWGDEKQRKMYEFLVREHNPSKYVDVKVAITGAVDSGKSSCIGTLLTGEKDDGRGKARLQVFNFAHEMRTGRTSSVAHHILGFNSSGKITNYGEELGGRKKAWPDIIKASDKVITFFDLCGHEKYLKTTILGLTSQFPDLVFVMVGANMGMTRMTREHIFLCLSLHIPFVVIITKIDICKNRKNVLKETVSSVKDLLKKTGIRKVPYDVHTEEDVLLCNRNIHSMSMVPFFYISNVTGEGIPYVKSFLNIFSRKPKENKELNPNTVEYHVEQTFQVQGVGTVVGGQLLRGTVKIGDKLLLGPNNNSYRTVQVKSIHIKRVSVDTADSGQYVCLALKKIDRESIHRGNVMLSIVDKPVQVREFDAEIAVLRSHSTTIKVGFEPIVHTCSIRQAATITKIVNKVCNRQGKNDDVLRTGDKATVRFKFRYTPEFIREGFRLLLAEGRVKVIGKVVGITEETCKVE